MTKNVIGLIRAYNILRKKNIAHKLLIAGKIHYNEPIELVKSLGLSKDIIFLKFVSDEFLPYLYTMADIFVLPSFYEGFGIPPLEAMGYGVPVITSNVASLPEVVGDAGIMVEPHDINSLAENIYKVLNDESLREEMRKKGKGRAKLFTWEKTAKEPLKVYRKVLD